MKAKTVTDYDWAMYIDASGDDGFAFDRGSSITYTVNSFLCETCDIEYNKEILNRIKDIMQCAHKNEIKSSTIIKSKKRSQICDLLSELRGALFQFVLFKKTFDPSEITAEQKAKHVFSTLAHSITIGMAASFHKHYHKSICIIIDNMKKEEILGTVDMVKKQLSDVEYDILFADSKNTDHQLLQVSDYFAGLTNKACIEHEKSIIDNPTINRCPPCDMYRNLCRNNPQSIQTPLFYDIQRYVNLFILMSNKDNRTIMGNGIQMFPIYYTKRYRFFDCVLLKHKYHKATQKR